jgi:hypothetical protein
MCDACDALNIQSSNHIVGNKKYYTKIIKLINKPEYGKIISLSGLNLKLTLLLKQSLPTQLQMRQWS